MSNQAFEPVRVGVVGMGGFGRLHASTILGLAETNLVALVARRQETLDEVADDYPGVPGWLDIDKAIAESDAEAWIVASSTSTHVTMTRSLLEAGHAVLLEKPISEDLDEASSLSPLVNDDSSNLMMGHILLFNSEFLEMQAQARQRGPVHYFDCVRYRPATVLQDYPGESPFHLTMVHDLYCAFALTNGEEPVEFSSQIHRHQTGALDLALAQLRWPSGTVGSFTAAFLTVPGMSADGFDRMEVFGEGWAGRLQANPRPLEIWDDKARWPMELEIRADQNAPTGMMAEELRCFCRVVRGMQSVPQGATYQDAMRVQQWVDRLAQVATG